MNGQRIIYACILTIVSVTLYKLFPKTAAAAEPVAVVNGSAIGTDEVEKALAPQLNKLDEQIYNLKRQKIDGLINDKLLADEAKKRGISMPALVDAAVTSKVGLVAGSDITMITLLKFATIQLQVLDLGVAGRNAFLTVSPCSNRSKRSSRSKRFTSVGLPSKSRFFSPARNCRE